MLFGGGIILARMLLLLFCSLGCMVWAGEFDLVLGDVRFDPLDQDRAQIDDPAWFVNEADAPANDLQLIQLVGKTQASDIAMLRAAGLEPLQYIHPYSYVVWPTQAARTQTQRLDQLRVRWQGFFQPAYRVLPQYRGLGEHKIQDFVLAAYAGLGTQQVVQALTHTGAQNVALTSSDGRFNLFRLQASATQLPSLARVAGVYAIQPAAEMILRNEFSKQLNRGVRDTGVGVPTGYVNWLAQLGYDGSGVRVAIVDSGVQENHPDLAPAMVDCLDPDACGSIAYSVHGSHVAGIVGARNVGGDTDSNGYLEGIGVAPGVEMLDLRSNYYANIGVTGLMQLTVQNGAVISNNSWGTSSVVRGYDLFSREVDVGVRDADLTTAGLQPLTYVQAIENGFGGVTSIGAPEEAKNSIRVGSTRVRNSAGVLESQVDSLSVNSAHGPGLDSRNIPDLVAPGCYVLSCNNNTDYALRCGTSMASPHVAGSAALFFEQYRDQTGIDPSPALIKAALLNASKSLIGQLDADDVVMTHLLDGRQGYGMLEANTLMQPQSQVLYVDGSVVFSNSGDLWQENIVVPDPTEPVRIMLVYTDAPGHGMGGAAPAISNDLDLSVIADGQTFLGNVFNGSGLSVTGGQADDRNNSEGVFLAAGQVDAFELRVSANNIAWDAIPDNGLLTDQDFAIVCYNCTPQPGFAFKQISTSFALCREQNDQGTALVTPLNGFDDNVTLEAINAPAGVTVTFDPEEDHVDQMRAFTVALDNSVIAGTYTVDIRASGSGGQEAFTSFVLRVSEDVPQVPEQLEPLAKAVDVARKPEFVWSSGSENDFRLDLFNDHQELIASYDVSAALQFQIPDKLPSFSVFGWQITALNPCGASQTSPMRWFRTRFQAPILLVDDDDNSPDVRDTYTDALAAQGWRFDVWDTQNSAVEPVFADVENYQWVIWFTGDARALTADKAGPNIETIPHLNNYLSGGGNLWMVSANLYSRSILFENQTLTDFVHGTLGVEDGMANSGQVQIFGIDGTPFEDRDYLLVHPFQDNSDTVSPSTEAQLMFAGLSGNAGIFRETAESRIVYWSFPFESIPADQQVDAMAAMGTYMNITSPFGCFNVQDVQRQAAALWPGVTRSLLDLITCVNAYGVD